MLASVLVLILRLVLELNIHFVVRLIYPVFAKDSDCLEKYYELAELRRKASKCVSVDEFLAIAKQIVAFDSEFEPAVEERVAKISSIVKIVFWALCAVKLPLLSLPLLEAVTMFLM